MRAITSSTLTPQATAEATSEQNFVAVLIRAEAGEAEAQFNLGLKYANGEGVPKDAAQAVAWYRKAADQGYASAQFNLGVMYANGEGVPKDAAQAVAWYRKAADQGHASAQNNLGLAYANGDGVPKDAAQAVAWYRKAADQGHALAQCNLGLKYANGDGVPKDAAQAVAWYRKAADQGDAWAQNNLGVKYANGEGVLKDATQAVAWYRKAADQGYASAQFNLGVMYANGEGVPKDATQAIAWYRKATDQGYASAQFNLGMIYANGEGVPKDAAQAVAWYRKAADQGHASAQNNLGLAYANGDGVPKDAAQAVAWYRKAADQGLATAQFNLGGMYAKGEGVPKDAAQAVAWYRKAADQGHALAPSYLDQLLSANRNGVPKDDIPASQQLSRSTNASIDDVVAEKMKQSQHEKEVELAFFQFYLANPERYERGVFDNCVYSRDRNRQFINEVRSEIVFPPSLVGQEFVPLEYGAQRANAVAQRSRYPSLIEGSGWVYIYSLGSEKQCKIGSTNNPSRRFDEFFRETGSPRRHAHFVALFKVPAHSEERHERHVHQRLAGFREKGASSEWFDITPAQAFTAIKEIIPNAEVIDYCGLTQEYHQRKAQAEFDEKYKRVVAEYFALKQSIIDRPKKRAEALARQAAEAAARHEAEMSAAKAAKEKALFDADVNSAREFRTGSIWLLSGFGALIPVEVFSWPARSNLFMIYLFITLAIAALLFFNTPSPEETARKKAEKRLAAESKKSGLRPGR